MSKRSIKIMGVVAITQIDDAGIAFQWFTQKGKTRHEGFLPWHQIARATAFKRDLFTYDLICLRLVSTDRIEIEIDEEDLHWTPLMDKMGEALPNSKKWGAWFPEVAFPAFETNEQTIYEH